MSDLLRQIPRRRMVVIFVAAILLSLFAPNTTRADTSLSIVVAGADIPVVGATVSVYAAGPAAVTAIGSGQTDSSGSVSIAIANPGGDVVLYAVASGGDAGHGTNSAIALMSVFGTGSNYNSPIVIDELTTIASIWSMRNFLHPDGTIFGPAPGLQNAALTVTNLADLTHGLPSSLLLQNLNNSPAKLNTLANLLAACAGSSGASSPTCSALFSQTTLPNQAAPANTIAAAFNIANNPGLNLASLFAVANQSSAYAPAWPRPLLNWLLSVNIPVAGGGGVFAIDSSGDLWVSTDGGISKISPTGVAAPGSPFSGGGFQGAAAMAIDTNGNIWIDNFYPATTVSEFDPGGHPLSPDTGYEVPSYSLAGIAIDQSGHVWIANDNPNPVGENPGALLELDSTGTVISGNVGFTGGGLFQPGAVAIDSRGNVWVTNDQRVEPGGKIKVKGGSVSRFGSTGAPLSPKKGYREGNISYPEDIAIDALGNAWVANHGRAIAGKLVENVAKLKPGGAPVSPPKGYRGGGINQPSAIAIDGAGVVWVLDSGLTPTPCGNLAANEISVLTQKGAPISPDVGYLIFPCGFTDDSYVDGLRGIAIDPSGNVWFANAGIRSMLELVGAAAPVKTPLIGPPQKP